MHRYRAVIAGASLALLASASSLAAVPATKEQATATLKAQYADYALPVIVDFSVGGRLEN